MRRSLALVSGFVLSCAATPPRAETVLDRAETRRAPVVEAPPHESLWPTATQSPSPAESDESPREASLRESCGAPDAALARVARHVAEERARGLGTPDPDAIVALLRAAGDPHVRPRVLAAIGRGSLDDTNMKEKLRALHGKVPSRCAVALAETPHGGELLVAVAFDAIADLAPLPIRARTGEWLTFEAHVAVPAHSAKLVILGPRGAPRTVPTSLDASGRARASFAIDHPGAFLVQLVGDLEGGPRPLLEARIFADVAPPDTIDLDPAPGEEAGTENDAASLEKMIAATRKLEALPPLKRDARLDALAAAHAAKMLENRVAAHDVGDGDLRERFEADDSNARFGSLGENVARASSVARAHRAIYASPSHRIVLLDANYTHIGIAVATAPDGTVYVCETFAGR